MNEKFLTEEDKFYSCKIIFKILVIENATYNKHDEEDRRPDGCSGEFEHHLRVGEKDEARAALDDLRHLRILLQGDVTQDGKGHAPSQQGRQRVHDACDNCVP